MLAGVDDRAEYAAAPDEMLAGPRLDIEDQEATFVFHEPSPRANGCADSHGFQVIYLNSRAH